MGGRLVRRVTGTNRSTGPMASPARRLPSLRRIGYHAAGFRHAPQPCFGEIPGVPPLSRTRLLDFARWASFGVLLLLAVVLRERPSQVFDQAIIWVPTGVAIAGVYLLGYRAALVVAVVTVLQRLLLGYSWAIVWPAGMGSAAEAVLGAFLLKRLGVHPACSRLRDVAVVLVVAAAAPLGSIFFSWIGRAYGQWPADLPFYSGWDGWWRMNALGALAVVPFALTWMGVKWSEWTPRFVGLLALSCAGIGAVIFGALTVVPHGTSGILWLNLVLLPIVMYAAARFGVRATTFASSLAALTVAVATANGHGPFLQVVKDQRHVAVQLFWAGRRRSMAWCAPWLRSGKAGRRRRVCPTTVSASRFATAWCGSLRTPGRASRSASAER